MQGNINQYQCKLITMTSRFTIGLLKQHFGRYLSSLANEARLQIKFVSCSLSGD